MKTFPTSGHIYLQPQTALHNAMVSGHWTLACVLVRICGALCCRCITMSEARSSPRSRAGGSSCSRRPWQLRCSYSCYWSRDTSQTRRPCCACCGWCSRAWRSMTQIRPATAGHLVCHPTEYSFVIKCTFLMQKGAKPSFAALLCLLWTVQ